MRREGKKYVKGFNTRCQPALVRSRVVRSTWSVPDSVQGAGASGEQLRPRTGCGVEERRPLTRDMVPEAARRRRPVMCRDVGGPVRRVWFMSPHTGRCTKPLPRQPPSAPGLCWRAASRTLPSSAMSGRDARRGPTWPMSPDGASEAGRRNRPEAHRTRAARRRTSHHEVRQAQAEVFHVKHTSCTPSL